MGNVKKRVKKNEDGVYENYKKNLRILNESL